MKKHISFIILIAILLSLTGCAQSINAPSEQRYMLADIRSEAEKFDDLRGKYSNLNLKDTRLYVPDVDEITDLTIRMHSYTAEELEKVFLEAVEKFNGNTPDINNIIYIPEVNDTDYVSEDDISLPKIPYSQAKGIPNRNTRFSSIVYSDDEVYLSIMLFSNFISAQKKEINEIANFDGGYFGNRVFRVEDGGFLEAYDLRGVEIPDVSIMLRDGAADLRQSVESITGQLKSGFPYYNSDTLILCPKTAEVYTLGEQMGLVVRYYYEYQGVPLDSRGSYGENLETRENDLFRFGLRSSAAMFQKDFVDELYGGRTLDIEHKETHDKFIGLDDFLSMVSDKLTGNKPFTIGTVELCYGLKQEYPESANIKTATEAAQKLIRPDRISAAPVWIANFDNTGISDSPTMAVIVDAVTGEMEVVR